MIRCRQRGAKMAVKFKREIISFYLHGNTQKFKIEEKFNTSVHENTFFWRCMIAVKFLTNRNT